MDRNKHGKFYEIIILNICNISCYHSTVPNEKYSLFSGYCTTIIPNKFQNFLAINFVDGDNFPGCPCVQILICNRAAMYKIYNIEHSTGFITFPLFKYRN
jgi:hypothetical protein